jgi:hypothetical protein
MSHHVINPALNEMDPFERARGATYPPIPTVKARSDQSLPSMIGISLPM